MSMPDKDKDWLEPPGWWKKWRPLRWLVGALLLAGFWIAVAPLLPESAPEPTPERSVVVAQATASPTPPAPSPEPRPSPEPVATPETTVTPTPKPVVASPTPTALPAVAAGTAEPVAEVEEQVYFEESPMGEATDSEIAAFTRVDPNPVRLLGPYRSYASVDEVVFDLERAGFAPIVESRHAKVRTGMPPRDLDTVTVMQFRHWDVPGRLQLQFFNDRLYQTEFEPEDATRYKTAQQRELPQLKRETSGRSEYIAGHLRIASSLDLAISEVGRKLDTRPFLIWQDRRLVRQRDEWDRRFALAAVP